MFLQILVTLLVANGALSEEMTRLRGSSASVKHDVFSNQEVLLGRQEQQLGEYLNRLYQLDGNKVDQKRGGVSEKSASEPLEWYGSNSQLANLTYENFIISRQYKEDDCTGEGKGIF